MKGALIAVLLLIAFGLLWLAGEAHYRNCLDAAKHVPDTRTALEQALEASQGGRDTHAALVYRRITGCSRLPF